MIEPLRKGEPYPGRRPPVLEQWRELPLAARITVTLVPSAVVLMLLALNPPAGAAAAVLVLGVAAATITYAKNRTDRHNAAIDRGELSVPDDPHLIRVDPSTMDPTLRERFAALGYPPADLGPVKRFEGGWIAKRRNVRDVAVVAGDDGGVAYFDPRWVPDVHAANEYLAGRGREPA